MTVRQFLTQGVEKKSKRYALIALICLLGFALNFYLFYPGFVSPDTLDQFRQALYNTYGNWHPPTMAAFWHILLNFWAGPQSMLIFQLLLLWGGTALLLDIALHQTKFLSLFVLAIIASPFVQNVAGNIWKDLQMSLSWFFATASILHAIYWKREYGFTEFFLILILIMYGTWVRISGFPGSMALLYLLWRQTNLHQKYRSYAASTIMAVLLTLFSLRAEAFFSKHILKANNDHIEYKLILHDLSGLSVRANKDCFPPVVSSWPSFNLAYIKQHYRLESFDNIWWNPEHIQLFPNLSEEQHKELQNYWRSSIIANLSDYLKMKYEGTLLFLKIRESGNGLMIIHPYVMPNSYGFALKPNARRDFFFSEIGKQADRPYMKPWFWVICNILLFIPLVFNKLGEWREQILLLNLSAFLYLAIHFFVYPADTEFRYFYWYSLCISLSAFMLALAIVMTRKPIAPAAEKV